MSQVEGYQPRSLAVPRPLQGAKEKVAEQMLGESLVGAPERQQLIEDLSLLPENLLERLQQDGTEIRGVQNSEIGGKKIGGSFRPLTNTIELDQEVFASQSGPRTLYHEIGHKIDAGTASTEKRLLAVLSNRVFPNQLFNYQFSDQEGEFKTAYQAFQGRTIANLACDMRKITPAQASDQPQGYDFIHPFAGPGTFVKQPGVKDDVMLLKHPSHRIRDSLVAVATGALVTGLGIATGGMAGGILLGVGLATGACGLQKLADKPEKLEAQVNGIRIKRDENQTVVALPKNSQPQPTTWTEAANYITFSGRREELFAEGASALLSQSQASQDFRSQDPIAARFVSQSIDRYTTF